MTITTTHTKQRRRWRFAIAAALSVGVAGLVSITPSSVSASAENVVIYFAVCDGSGASDTVKIKKINEDGTGLTVVGDTTIAYCQQGGEGFMNTNRFLSGLAVSGDYAYFSWFDKNGSASGIGRLKKDGSGTTELNFANGPTGVGSFQMSPNALDGYLYVYVNDFGGTANSRIMRVTLNTGSVTNCYTPSGTIRAMSIGVGKSSVYYSVTRDNAFDEQLLMKVSSDCRSSSEFVNLADLMPDGLTHKLITDGMASLVAESDTNMFLFTQTTAQQPTYGISQLTTSATISEIQSNIFTIEGSPPASQVWGFNYLYFKDGAARKMYRVKPGGTVERAFATQIPGDYTLHHMSVVKEAVTVAAPATTAPPATKAPLLINKKGVTGKQIATDLGITIPKRSKIKLAVAKKSRKVCAVKKSRVVATQKGKNCRVTITITPKKGKAIKRTTSFTTS